MLVSAVFVFFCHLFWAPLQVSKCTNQPNSTRYHRHHSVVVISVSSKCHDTIRIIELSCYCSHAIVLQLSYSSCHYCQGVIIFFSCHFNYRIVMSSSSLHCGHSNVISMSSSFQNCHHCCHRQPVVVVPLSSFHHRQRRDRMFKPYPQAWLLFLAQSQTLHEATHCAGWN